MTPRYKSLRAETRTGLMPILHPATVDALRSTLDPAGHPGTPFALSVETLHDGRALRMTPSFRAWVRHEGDISSKNVAEWPLLEEQCASLTLCFYAALGPLAYFGGLLRSGRRPEPDAPCTLVALHDGLILIRADAQPSIHIAAICPSSHHGRLVSEVRLTRDLIAIHQELHAGSSPSHFKVEIAD